MLCPGFSLHMCQHRVPGLAQRRLTPGVLAAVTPRRVASRGVRRRGIMTDALGWRAKFGVLAPSTNTIVEPDFYHMNVPGVTAHFSRIHIRNQNLSDDAAFEALLGQVRQEIGYAVERVMTAEPDYMVMGMSSETFWGGVEGNRQFIQQIKALSGGLGVATGAEA